MTRALWPEMSRPCVLAIAIERWSGAWPACQSPMPAELIRKSSAIPRSATTARNTPSASGERQILPRQTNRIDRLAIAGLSPETNRERHRTGRARCASACHLAAASRLSHISREEICHGRQDPFRNADRTIDADEGEVREKFWRTAKRAARQVPFMEEVVAAYYCALDRNTPLRAKAILLAALGYFVLPADTIPDVVLGLGFTDDIAVLTAAITAVRAHMTPAHAWRRSSALAGRLRRLDRAVTAA